MSKLGKLWAGNVFGTNTGKLFISFDEDGPELKGVLRFNDDDRGAVVYQIEGRYENEIQLTGTTTEEAEGVEYGDLAITAVVTPEGRLKGEWSTSIGTGGTLVAYPHDSAQQQQNAVETAASKEQFFTRSFHTGALSLSRDNIFALLDVISGGFDSRAIVTYRDGGANVTKFADEFRRDPVRTEYLEYLKLFIQQQEEFGVNRVVAVELNRYGENTVTVQGVHEVWVEGKVQTIKSEMKRRRRPLVTNLKEFGVNLNLLVLFAIIVIMPSFGEIWKRIVFGVVAFTLLRTVHWIHSSYIPNASIRMNDQPEGWLYKVWPSVLSIIVSVVGGVALAYVVKLLELD